MKHSATLIRKLRPLLPGVLRSQYRPVNDDRITLVTLQNSEASSRRAGLLRNLVEPADVKFEIGKSGPSTVAKP